MKKHNYICQTDINNNNLTNNNEEFSPKSHAKFYYINNNYLMSPSNKNKKNININRYNNENMNKRAINTLCQNKSLPNYSLENNLNKYHKIIFSNKNSFSKHKIDNNNLINKSPTNKYIFNEIEKEIKMIKIQLAGDILKNKIQQLHNLGNNNNYKNNCANSNNIKIKKNNNNKVHKRNIVLTNIGSNNNIPNNIPNNNSLKNIYYINNNFRINSIQNNENRNIKIPKSAFNYNSPTNNIHRHKKSNIMNNIINISNQRKKTEIKSPKYFIPNSAFNDTNNNIYRYNNYITPKSDNNTLVNKNRIKNINILPQGFFDDYLLNENILMKKKNIIIKRNNNMNLINKTYKNEMKSKDILKIENYNNFFISSTKEKKEAKFKTQNKIINFAYISSQNKKTENLIKNNKVINAINLSFNPVKINFEKENISPNKNENKTLTELINPNELEEKSIILENNSIEEDKPKKKLIFDDIKIIIEYNQTDYLRNCNSIYKMNSDKNKCDKIPHKFISTTKLCNLFKKKNKNLKSNLIKNNSVKYNPNLALMKLNELIDDEPKKNKNKENSKPKYIQKNINFIKKLEECNKKGINPRSLTLSKNEIKLLNKNKKNLKNNTQQQKQNLSKEKINVDDKIINKFDKINEDDKNKLNNSFS